MQIEHEESKFLEDWLCHPEWWFNSSHVYDDLITAKYGNLLEVDVTSDVLAFIILYDQVPRHFYRKESAEHIITYFRMKAVNLIDRNIEMVRELDGHKLCFALLPYRHRDTSNYFNLVLDIIWNKLLATEDQTLVNIYQRYLKATYERHDIHNSVSISQYSDDVHSHNALILQVPTKVPFHNLNVYDDILDYNGEHLTNTDTGNQVLNLNLKTLNKYIISLSGGVDSMVCCYIAKQSVANSKVTAVHINYCNRDTSMQEEKFVRDWCAQHGVTLYVRRIKEINRPLCMKYELRNTYETYTRNIRYATYMKVAEHAGMSSCNVILGHNKDDCFENILTNINKKTKYENLLGIQDIGIQNGITFYRPMLHIWKREIVAFAHQVGIPYLYDSTPSWSQRGKIRDSIVPMLTRWDVGVINSFFDLAENMRQTTIITNIYIDNLLDVMTIQDTNDSTLVFEVNQIQRELLTNMIFWREIIDKVILKYNITTKKPSHKSLTCMLDRFQKQPESHPTITAELTKQLRVVVNFAARTITLKFHNNIL